MTDWKSIQARAITHCTKCNSRRSYGNPFATCFECEKRFCFDHILGGQVNDKMGQNEQIRDVCEIDHKKHQYRPVGSSQNRA